MKYKRLLFLCALGCLFVADAAAQTVFNGSPTRVIGQPNPNINTSAPNLVDGRELFNPQGVALDTTVSPPILYVADTGNNRVLAWRNAVNSQNGTKADLVIGQRDFFTTAARGSGTNSGLSAPTGLVVDAGGNLWVADSGDNRILRFPKPFEQTDGVVVPDFVIGQRDLSGISANQGQQTPSESTLNLAANNQAFRCGLAFDPAGNLWVSDSNNHRIVRFPASRIGSGAANGPAADVVLGQQNFASRTALGISTPNRQRKDQINTPSGIVVDSASRVYAADALGRVLVWTPPYGIGSAAARIAGVISTAVGQPPPPATNLNAISLGISATNTIGTPYGVFLIGGTLAVVDTPAHRIMRFAAFDQWPAEVSQFSPTSTAFFGQPDVTSGKANGGNAEAFGGGFNVPLAAVANATGDEIFVADAANNRVLRLGGAPNFRAPLQVFGQLAYSFSAVNLVEGREVFLFDGFTPISGVSASFAAGTGIATEGTHLYIADTINHRVLGYRDVSAIRNGSMADLVIGQTDFYRTQVNSPANDVGVLGDAGLIAPAGVAVDANGDLWVSDSGNARVLRFPRPFDRPAGTTHRANLVLGQSGFTSKFTDPTPRTMARPFGLAIASDGSVLASDAAHNRVLLFRRPAGGDFVNGQSAERVFGQPDFISTATSTANIQRLLSPRGLAIDAAGRLYVCDTGRHRVTIFDTASPGTDPVPTYNITLATATGNINSPHGVYVSPTTAEIWVTDTVGNRVLRYPKYDQLVFSSGAPDATIAAQTPLDVALDQFGNLVIADGRNRVVFHYPSLAVRQSANFLQATQPSQRALAPNTYGSIYSLGLDFADREAVFDSIPMSNTLADTQVFLNDQAVPLHFVARKQINFLVPNGAPTSGTAELVVIRASTGQVLSAGTVPMAQVAPGLFTHDNSGTGQLAASNQDGGVNSPENPAPRGSFISLYGTGVGAISGAPPDGVPPSGEVNVAFGTQVFMGNTGITADIQYSGLAPCCVGLWQINAKIPEGVVSLQGNLPGPVLVQVQLGSTPTFVPPQRTTISVKQQ